MDPDATNETPESPVRGTHVMGVGADGLDAFEREGIELMKKPFRELTRAQKVAMVLSLAFSPNLTGPVAYGWFLGNLYLDSDPAMFWTWLWWGIYVFAFHPLILPVVLAATKRGDIYVTDRRMRFWPFISALAGYVVFVAFAGNALGWDTLPIRFLLGSIVLTGLVTAISLKWKISIHMTGNGTAFCAMVFLSPLSLVVTVPIHLAVAWARHELKAHTASQLVTGTVLGFGVPALVLALLG
ncbi:MAG: hypothetical protein ACTSU5_12705 [Promethearchaeota archaeon]